MPGMATGLPGAKSFDEMHEQKQTVMVRNANKGRPPEKQIILEPQAVKEFRKEVLRSLGVGQIITYES